MGGGSRLHRGLPWLKKRLQKGLELLPGEKHLGSLGKRPLGGGGGPVSLSDWEVDEIMNRGWERWRGRWVGLVRASDGKSEQ